MQKTAVKVQSNIGPLTVTENTKQHLTAHVETRKHQNKPGYAAPSHKSRQDSRQPELKLVLKSGRT